MFLDDDEPRFRPRRSTNTGTIIVIVLCVAAVSVYVNDKLQAFRGRGDAAATRLAPSPPPTRDRRLDRPATVEPTPFPPGPSVRELPSPPSRVTIYLCKSYEGGTFWSNGVCSAQRATIDRMTDVPASLSFDQQVAIARGAANEAAALYRVDVQTAPAVIGGAAQGAAPPSECGFLNEQLRQLDSWARNPHSGQEQDVIRRERMQLMSRRAALRC